MPQKLPTSAIHHAITWSSHGSACGCHLHGSGALACKGGAVLHWGDAVELTAHFLSHPWIEACVLVFHENRGVLLGLGFVEGYYRGKGC